MIEKRDDIGLRLGQCSCSEHFIHFEFPAIQFHSNWLNQLSFLLAEEINKSHYFLEDSHWS